MINFRAEDMIEHTSDRHPQLSKFQKRCHKACQRRTDRKFVHPTQLLPCSDNISELPKFLYAKIKNLQLSHSVTLK